MIHHTVKKQPGDMARARARHLRRQDIQDAISATRRAGPDDPAVRLRLHHHPTHGWCEWDLTPFPPKCTACREANKQPAPEPAGWDDDEACRCWDWPCPAVYLVRITGSRLEVCQVTDRDGFRACTSTGNVYIHNPERQLLACAAPANEAARCWA